MTTEPLTAEFDALAGWTEEAVSQLGRDYALPAACRGSGSPSALAWLAESLALASGQRVLDAGSGVGGPAAWLHEHYAVRVFPAEPMIAAAGASRRMFGLPAVAAWSQSLPFGTAAFDAVWSLGVWDTIPGEREQIAFLRELRRVLSPAGSLGLSVVTTQGRPLADPPQGNAFPRASDLPAMLTEAGFATVQTVDAAALAVAPVDWQARADRVSAAIESAHGDEPAWRQADAQAGKIGRLLHAGDLTIHIVHARPI